METLTVPFLCFANFVQRLIIDRIVPSITSCYVKLNIHDKQGMHSSSMRTAHLLTVSHSIRGGMSAWGMSA